MYANNIDNSNAVQVIALNSWHFIVCISVVSTYILSLFESTGVLHQLCFDRDDDALDVPECAVAIYHHIRLP